MADLLVFTWPLVKYSGSTAFYEKLFDTSSYILNLNPDNTNSLQMAAIIVVMIRIVFKNTIFSMFQPLQEHTCSWG